MRDDRKTLVILTPAFPENESADYWVPSQQLLVQALQKKFPELGIVVLSLLYPAHNAEYIWHNIPVTSFGGMKQRKWKRLILWRNAWKKLASIRKQKNVIGLLSFWCTECALIGSWFGKRNRLPHYCWICGQDARASNNYVRYVRPKPQELIAISDFVSGEFFRNHHIRPGYVVPNGIDERIFPSGEESKRDIDILGVGALIPLKQYDIFIDTVKMIKEQIPGIRAVLCGKGEEKEKLSSLINGASLQNNIQLAGALHHREVLQLMQRSKVLLHPSAYEGFPTVCLEALYAGARVISFVQPMNDSIKNWHVVANKEAMVIKTLELLAGSLPEPGPVLLHSMNDIARKFMQIIAPSVTPINKG